MKKPPDAREPAPPSVGYRELIRENPDFRNLWFAQIVSLLGDWFNFVATAALVAELTDSGLAIGALFVVRMLAPFLVSPPAGVAADRWDRRHILIAADLTRAIVVLGFLLVRRPEQVWLLYALTAAQLGISGFFYPARTALLPDVVSDRAVGAANAVSSATWSVMLALGAALGGLVAGTFGVYPAFVIDSATFVASALFVLRVRVEPASAPPEAHAGGGFALYREGLAYLARHKDILFISLQKAANALCVASGFQVVQVGIAQDVFPRGEAGGLSLGLMFAVAGVGTGVGPILARRITGDDDARLRKSILVGYLLSAGGLFMIAPLLNFGSVLLATFIRGAGGGMVWVFSTQLLLHRVPSQMLGRVLGTEFAAFTLAGALGATVAGWAVDTRLALAGTTLLLGAATLTPMVLWAVWLRRRGR